MKRALFFITSILAVSASFAAGPQYRHKEPTTELEFQNVYNDLRAVKTSSSTLPAGSTQYIQNTTPLQTTNVHLSSGAIDSFTAQSSTVTTTKIGSIASSPAMGGNKFTGLAAGSANGDSVRFEQLKIIQVSSFSCTSETDTTSTSFIDTCSTKTFTPTSASNMVLILSTNGRVITFGSNSAYVTIDRAGTSLGGANGFCQVGSVGASVTGGHCSMAWLDFPATTSQVTYKVRMRSSSGAQIIHGDGTIQNTLILVEVAP